MSNLVLQIEVMIFISALLQSCYEATIMHFFYLTWLFFSPEDFLFSKKGILSELFLLQEITMELIYGYVSLVPRPWVQ